MTFRERVLCLVKDSQCGKVVTYQEVARLFGNPTDHPYMG